MAFELSVALTKSLENEKQNIENEFSKLGFKLELCPDFELKTWEGGFLPIKLIELPQQYLFNLSQIIQISGFELYYEDQHASLRTAMGRTIAELILQCYFAAIMTYLSEGTYIDPQTGNAFEGKDALKRAHEEIMEYEEFIDDSSKKQHTFTKWGDYLG